MHLDILAKYFYYVYNRQNDLFLSTIWFIGLLVQCLECILDTESGLSEIILLYIYVVLKIL